MRRRKLLLWHISGDNWPAKVGAVKALSVSYEDNPALLDHLGAEWCVISHSLLPVDGGASFILTLWLETDAVAGDAVP